MEFSSLPNEILLHIFSFMDHKNRMAVLGVCRRWNALASTTQFIDRIWLRLAFDEYSVPPYRMISRGIQQESKFAQQITILRDCFHKYRHVVVDCHYSYSSGIIQLAEMFTSVNNVETLVLFGMQNKETAKDLLILLQNVPKLKRLCLLGTDFLQRGDLELACFSDFPNLEYMYGLNRCVWTDIFVHDSDLVLTNVNDVVLTVPMGFNLRIESFQRMFPNLDQLQVTMNDPSLVKLVYACKDQLIKLSMCSINISTDLLTQFYTITFPKLSHLCLSFRYSSDEMNENFFTNPYHVRNLRVLKLFRIENPIMTTICSNCTFLRVLEVSTINIDFLGNISNLRNLEKLSITDSSYSLRNQEFVHQPTSCQPIQSLKNVKIHGFFGPTSTVLSFIINIAPNLEVLSLANVGKAEETLNNLSEALPKLRHLELGYWNRSKQPPHHNVGYLKNFTTLVSYSLSNMEIDDDGIQKWIQMAPNLSRITITRCDALTNAQLMTFGSCCPKLTEIKLVYCGSITAQGLKEFKEKVPHVAITCKKSKKRKPYLDDSVAYQT